MNKVIEYIISAKDKTGQAINSAISGLKKFSLGALRNLANIKAGFDMVRGAFSKFAEFMQTAFKFEKMTVQFKMLIGDIDKAREHMQMLKELGDTPPFSLDEFAAASRSLMVMSEGALGYKRSLEMIGDAAAATGQPLQTVAHEVGRAYAVIRDGQPITRATMALRNMGIITPAVAAKLEEMQSSGQSTAEMWKTLTVEIGKYKGSMAETEKTADGMLGALGSQCENLKRTFSTAFLDISKNAIGKLTNAIKDLCESGDIELWLEKVVEKVEDAIVAFQKMGETMGWIWEKTGLSDVYHTAKGAMSGATHFVTRGISGMVNGEEGAWGNAWRESGDVAGREYAKGYWTKTLIEQGISTNRGLVRNYNENRRDEERGKWEDKMARRRIRQRKAALAGNGGTDEDGETGNAWQAVLDELDRKAAERRAKEDAEAAAKAAEEKRKAEIAAAEKAAAEEEKARIEMEKRIAKERQRLNKEIIDREQQAYTLAQKEQNEAMSRLREAEAKVAQAWGWYRDRESWKAQLQEERDNAAAEAQFAKDAERLKFRSDWRTAALSDEQEVVRRVLLAREEEQAAKEYAKQTAEAAAAAAESLKAIEEAITTEEA